MSLVTTENLPESFSPILSSILNSVNLDQYTDTVEEDRHAVTSREALEEAIKHGDIQKDSDAPLTLIRDQFNTHLHFLGILVARHFGVKHCRNTGYFMYHKNGFMRWHTNSNEEGTRIYISYPFDDAEFKYMDPETKKTHVIKENKLKWQMKSFKITKSAPLWHSVSTSGLRLSIGYNI